MCSMEKFRDKELTKENLESMLKNLRKDKENNELYKGEYISDAYSGIASCYSVSPDYFYTRKYFGSHLCNSCGKQFGKNLKDVIKECQVERYKDYLESDSNDIRMYGCYCFSNLLTHISMRDDDIIRLFKCKDLRLIIKPKDNSFYDFQYEFNRKLSFAEWCYLNRSCFCDKEGKKYDNEEDSRCFELDSSITSYESLVKKYNKLNLFAELKYNCPDCCKKGKKVFEFWIKFPDKKEYVISYPDTNSTYNDYLIAYKYLSGNNDYINLIQSMKSASFSHIDKLDIDCALNNIVGTNIVYEETELKNMFKLYCSKKGCEGKFDDKFLRFSRSHIESKISPQSYRQFIEELEDGVDY